MLISLTEAHLVWAFRLMGGTIPSTVEPDVEGYQKCLGFDYREPLPHAESRLVPNTKSFEFSRNYCAKS